MSDFLFRWRMFLTMLALSLVATGCAGVGFKRAGSVADFGAAEKSCRRQISQSYPKCMRALGWHVTMENPSEELMQAERPQADASQYAARPNMSGAPANAATSNAGGIPVASWWKLGGSSIDLTSAKAACGVPQDRVVSREMITCMAKRGWHGAGR